MTDQEVIQRCLELSPWLSWMNDEANIPTVLWVIGIEFLIHSLVAFWVMCQLLRVVEWIIGKLWTLMRTGYRYWQARRVHEN